MSTAAVERYEGVSEHKWAAWERLAAQLVKSPLGGQFQAKRQSDEATKRDQILLVAITMNALDMDLNPVNLAQFWVSDGKVNMSAQLMIGLAAKHGHELWFESDEDECTAYIVRQGSQREQKYRYTLAMARRAGLLDKWVERKVRHQGDQYDRTEKFVVGDDTGIFSDDERRRRGLPPVPEWAQKKIDAGDIKSKDNWQRFPELMLQARSATRAVKAACPDALLGLRTVAGLLDESVEDHVDDVRPLHVVDEPADDPDDEITDAELLDDDETSGAAPTGDTSDERADDWDRESIRNRLADLPDHLKKALLQAWKDNGWGSVKEDVKPEHWLLKAHVTSVLNKLHQLEGVAASEYTERRKHANAAMNEIGVKKDDDRHAFVREATGGETESTGKLTEEQLERVLTLVQHRKDEAALAAAEADGREDPTTEPTLQYADGDPERPF